MRPANLLRLALAGTRTDTVRVLLTATSAALATLSMLATATVLAIRPAGDPAFREAAGAPTTKPGVPGVEQAAQGAQGYAYQYTHNLLVEPGLRPGVAFALLMLCIPVLALAGQSAQLGAPARDRRLSQIRLAGATPRQAVAIAVAETGLAATLGMAVALAVYFVGRVLLHRPDETGRLPLPTDQLPPLWSMAVIGAGLPVLAAAFAALLLRRVAFTPFGVVRRPRSRPPRPWPGVLIALGVGAFAAAEPLARLYHRAETEMPAWLPPALLAGGGFVAMLGVVLGTGWISYAAGRILHRLTRRPAGLIAARRLMADPWTGSRAFAALLAGVMVGAGAAGIRALFTAEFGAREDANRAVTAAQGEEYLPDDNAFYFRSLDLVDAAVTVGMVVAGLGLLVFLAEGLVSRRRVYSALVATGVPRRVLGRTVGWQMLAPAAPAILLALAVGVALPRGLSREVRSGGYSTQVCATDWEQCQQAGSPFLRTVEIPEFAHPVGVPFAELGQVGGVALAAVLATVGVGLLFLRASTEVSELRVV